MNDAISEALTDQFDRLPRQMKKAARWVVDNPREVALCSMREQARRAGVQPATMTRLAQMLGLSGFDAIRAAYAEAMRDERPGLAIGATDRMSATESDAQAAFSADTFATLGRQISTLAANGTLSAVLAAAERIDNARLIWCLGARASFPVAWQLHYVLSLIGDSSRLFDGMGSAGADALRHARPEDVLVVVGVQPYTKVVVEITDLARRRGIGIVAITDSTVSPLAREGDVSIVVPTAGTSFFHTMTPAFAVAELLAALIARNSPNDALVALRKLDAHLDELHTYVSQ